MPFWFWLLLAAAIATALLGLAAWRLANARVREAVARIGRLSWRSKVRLARALVGDPRVPIWVRAIVPLLVLYLLLPVDVLPDFIPVIGHLDDLAVILIAGAVLVRSIPPAVIEEHLTVLEARSPTDG